MPWSGPGWVTAHAGSETQCGLACPCLIMSRQNTKHCEGEQCDHVAMRKIVFQSENENCFNRYVQ